MQKGGSYQPTQPTNQNVKPTPKAMISTSAIPIQLYVGPKELQQRRGTQLRLS